jgi:hypothetical protein
MYAGVHVQYSFTQILTLSTDFSKTPPIQVCAKIQQVGAKSFRTDVQTDGQVDVMKLMFALHSCSVNAPKTLAR